MPQRALRMPRPPRAHGVGTRRTARAQRVRTTLRPPESVARLVRVLFLPGSELPSPPTTLGAAPSPGLTGGIPVGHNARAPDAPIARYHRGTAGGRSHSGPSGLIPWSRTGAASPDHPSALGPALVPASCSPWRDLGIPGGRGFPGLPGCTLPTGLRAALLTPTPPSGLDSAAVGSRSSWCDLGIPGGQGRPGLPGCTPWSRAGLAFPNDSSALGPGPTAMATCPARCDLGTPGG